MKEEGSGFWRRVAPRLRMAWLAFGAVFTSTPAPAPAQQPAAPPPAPLITTALLELPGNDVSGPVTVFYPSHAAMHIEERTGLRLEVALNAEAQAGNGHLIVISHGSPSSPWVHFDLARALVQAGFTVAMPEHYADNYKDMREPGPPAWKRRPQEVARAIDRMRAEPRFASLDYAHVGMFGISAGGHTALTLAGGRWSPARIVTHCNAHMDEDFHACAGPSVALDGGWFDAAKRATVRMVLAAKFTDAAWYSYTDPRIIAIVAGVPFAADFDPASFAAPAGWAPALGMITVGHDRWLNNTYHGGMVVRDCPRCEHLLHLPDGGHGALLSPLPPDLSGSIGQLVADAPGFDRAQAVEKVNAVVVGFMRKHLLAQAQPVAVTNAGP